SRPPHVSQPPRSPRHCARDRYPTAFGEARCASSAEQRVQLAFALERVKLVRSADVRLADEYLRHRAGAGCAPQHLVALRTAQGDIVFGIVDIFLIEQALGANAVSASEFRIDVDLGRTHCNSSIILDKKDL